MKNKPIEGTEPKSDTITQLEQKNKKSQVQIDKYKIKIFELEQEKLERERQIVKLRLSEPKSEGGDIDLHVIPPKLSSGKDNK